MPVHAPSRQTAGANSILVMPESGMKHITLTQGQSLELAFEPDSVTFARTGNDLTISGDSGAGLTLEGFFVAENAGALPQLILPGGDSVPASGFLQSLHIDISTSAGPESAPTPPSSGEGEYADGAGDLINGLDRLGSLGTDQWAETARTADVHVTAGRRAGGAPGVPDNGPDGPPTPKEPPVFNARAVLYMQNEGDAPDGEPHTERGVTVQALAKNGDGQWEASGQAAASIQPHAGNDLDVNALIEFVTDEHGNITFRLTAAGKAWMAANGKDMVAYYTITDANGKSYVIQVVISADGKFDSPSEHNDNLDPSGLAHGEWHDGKDMSKETDYKTTSSNLSDDLRYTGKLSGAEINTGYAEDKNWGNDSVTINGELHKSAITSGSGNDVIAVSGLVGGSTIITGAGNDTVKTGDVTGSTIALGNTTDGADTDAAQKNDVNTLKAGDVTDSFIYGTAGREVIELGKVSGSTIVTGAGSDTVTAASLDGSTVALGNTVDKADTDSSQRADFNLLTVGADNTDYTADAVRNSNIYGTTGVDSIRIHGHVTGSTINTGSGNDTVNISGSVYSTGASDGNTIKAVDGNVGIDMRGAGAIAAVSASGVNARNTIEGRRVSIQAGDESTASTACGVLAQGKGASNTITGGELLAVTAEGDTAYGACARDGASNSLSSAEMQITAAGKTAAYGVAAQDGGKNSISARESVTITATGDTVYGVSAVGAGSTNTVSAKTLNITVEGTTAAYGVAAQNGGKNSISATEYVNIVALGDTAYGVLAQGTGATNTIKGKQVNIAAVGTKDTNGMAAQAGGSNSISAEEFVVVTAESRGGNANGVSASGAGASNTIKVDGGLRIEAEGRGSVNGINADGGGANSITAGSIEIAARWGQTSQAVVAQNGGMNSLKGENITIKATGDTAHGVSAQNGTNTISAVKGIVDIGAFSGKGDSRAMTADGPRAVNTVEARRVSLHAESEEGAAMGMHASRCATNQAYAIERVDISAKGGSSAHGMYAESGAANHVSGAAVTISAVGTKEANGMAALGNGSRNSVSTFGAVTISAQGESACGVRASGGGAENTVWAGGDLRITATGTGTTTTGVSADKGTNTVTGAGVGITALGGATAHAVAATNGGTNTISGGSRADITAEGGTARGLSAANGGVNTISAKTVVINANSTSRSGEAVGIYGEKGGSNTITAGGNVEISAKGGERSYAMMATGAGSKNDVKAQNVSLNAESNEGLAVGMYAQGYSRNTVEGAESVKLTVQSGGSAHGLYADYGSSKNSITGGTVDISVTGNNWGIGVGAWGDKASNSVTADGAMRITVEGGNAKGVSASGAGAKNTLKAGDLSITASGKADSHCVIAEAGGENSLSGGNIEIAAEAGWAAYGLFAHGKGSVNTVTADNKVDITATGNSATGMFAENGGRNEVSAKTVTIKADGTNSFLGGSGVFGLNGGTNSITAGGDVEISVTGGYFACGMSYLGKADANGVNSISAKGDVRITASGAHTLNHAMHAERFGGNEIRGAKNVTLRAEAENASSCVAMYASGREATDKVGAFNSIHDVEGAVTLIAKGAVGSSQYHGGNIGMLAYNGGQNTIYNAGSVDIQVESPTNGMAGWGMKACGSGAQGPQEMNYIHDITGKVSVDVGGGKAAYGMYAAEGGSNRIENTGGVDISAHDADRNYAMYAADGGVNTIANTNGNALIVVIKATGGSLNYAMFAGNNGRNEILGGGGNDVISLQGDIHSEGTGKNIIDTGAGDDHITLDGKVSGDFHLDAGDGYDTLVLRAASWDEFSDRYRAWLEANLDKMNIESLRWAFNGPAGDIPEWLHKLIKDYNYSHPDAQIDLGPESVESLAHFAAGGADAAGDPASKVSAAHMAEHTGHEHDPAAPGDGSPHTPTNHGNDGPMHTPADHNDNRDAVHAEHDGPHRDDRLADLVAGHGGEHGFAGDLFAGLVELASKHEHGPGSSIARADAFSLGDGHLTLDGSFGGIVDGGIGPDTVEPVLEFPRGNGAFSGRHSPEATPSFEELRFSLAEDDTPDLDALLDCLEAPASDEQDPAPAPGLAGAEQAPVQFVSGADLPAEWASRASAGMAEEHAALLLQNGLS